jgi:N,N'-diacetyllegionaminate synthase
LGIKLFKIPSGEVTNLPYLRDVAERANDIILSTGMCELAEVEAAIDALVQQGFPKNRITVLQCNTAYPTPLEDTNLLAMKAMGEKLNVSYGFSDHTQGISASVAAVALGATVIEKHVTLDKNLPGPDHLASMEPEEFALLVKTIREVEITLGSDVKTVTASEKANIPIARRGLYASREIRKGELITSEDVIALRPEANISPMLIDEVIGKPSNQRYSKFEPLSSKLVD